MRVLTSQELKEKLSREKVVEIAGDAFRIKKIPLLLLADDAAGIWDQARKDREELVRQIHSLVSHPSLPMLKRVLLAGLVEPKCSDSESDDAVPVDLILAHHEISVGLFIEIVNFSLEA